MTDCERPINALDLPDEISTDVQASIKAVRARARLRTILQEAHEQLPDVPEDEVEADVMEALRAVRLDRAT